MAGFEPGERAGGDQGVGQLGPLLVGAGAPVDPVRLGQRGDLVDEVEDALVGGRSARVGGGRALRCRRSCVRPARPLAQSRERAGSLGVVVGDLCPRPSAGAVGPSAISVREATSRIRARSLLDRSTAWPGSHCRRDRAPCVGARRMISAVRAVGYPRPVVRPGPGLPVTAPVAQRIEHLTTDQKVWGSNPYGRATW